MKLRQPPRRDVPLDPARLRILIVGTPKAGNTWLKHLLSMLYDLPIVDLAPVFADNDWASLGPRWIGQQHYDPTNEVLRWGAAGDVVFVAPVRHPGDVLVSLRHYVEKRGQEPSANTLEPDHMLLDPPGVYGEHTRAFLTNGFPLLLHLSIHWLRGGWAHGVRYCDLWRHPVATLSRLAEEIVPVSQRAVEYALCGCEANLMRRTVDVSGGLVRKGGVGSWMDELPPDVQTMLQVSQPYPAQFAALGYSGDPTSEWNERKMEPAAVRNPFRGGACFESGVPIAPILMRIFFELPLSTVDAWEDATRVGAGSYFDWLCQPAALDPQGHTAAPIVTELAMSLRARRADLQEVFADPFGSHRLDFCHWFVYYGVNEFGIDRRLTMPVLASWAAGPSLDAPQSAHPFAASA